MPLSDERLAKNEILFREINERLDEMSVPWSKTTDYLCECSDMFCTKVVELRNDEYERVRSRPTLFVVAHGHEQLEIEKVVEETEGYFLVEKIVAVDEIIRQDPRSGESGADPESQRRRSVE